MVFRYKYQNGTWVDLEKPTEDEIREIAKEFSISDRIAKEILSNPYTVLSLKERRWLGRLLRKYPKIHALARES